MKTIKITDNLFLEEVPKNAFAFIKDSTYLLFKSQFLTLKNITHSRQIGFDFKIHGLIQTPELTFDFEYGTGGYDKMILKERIQKAIQDAGILLLNPYKKPDNYELWQKYGSFTQYGESLSIHSQRWKESESKVVKGNLLLIEKIKWYDTNETKVYPLDNSHQGIYTIGDIIEELKTWNMNLREQTQKEAIETILKFDSEKVYSLLK